tara:strand:+ start:24780 stop:25016 length:237 start_codon:yes stop_codon:yes gene_type:complete
MTKRSEQQNKYYWRWVVLLLGNELGYPKNEMHAVLKHRFLSDSTKELDRDEFNNYLETIRCWAIQELNIKIPLPNETD